MFFCIPSKVKLYFPIINTLLPSHRTYMNVLLILFVADAYDNLIGFISKMDLAKNKTI
jgi:hypothetical protein